MRVRDQVVLDVTQVHHVGKVYKLCRSGCGKHSGSRKQGPTEEIPKGAKTVGCKWVYKTKRDSKGKIERYKARLIVKGFT